MHTIDTRNKPCPKPVLMTKKALEDHGPPFEILLDAGVPVMNVRRFLESRGLSVSLSENGPVATLTCTGAVATISGTSAEDAREVNRLEDIAIMICSGTLGRTDRQLGEVLMKGFLAALAERAHVPAAIALMNEGVKLALNDSSASESLKILQDKGSMVLVCGTCTNHFGITESVCVGAISNMFDISDTLMRHSRNIVLS